MPIFDFACQACGEQFETWVRKRDESPACPACASTDVEKLFSPVAVHGEGSHDKAMRAARRRDQAQARDRFHERRRYEESHDRHGH